MGWDLVLASMGYTIDFFHGKYAKSNKGKLRVDA